MSWVSATPRLTKPVPIPLNLEYFPLSAAQEPENAWITVLAGPRKVGGAVEQSVNAWSLLLVDTRAIAIFGKC